MVVVNYLDNKEIMDRLVVGENDALDDSDDDDDDDDDGDRDNFGFYDEGDDDDDDDDDTIRQLQITAHHETINVYCVLI